jgi:hypothetical protein
MIKSIDLERKLILDFKLNENYLNFSSYLNNFIAIKRQLIIKKMQLINKHADII